MKNRLIGNDPHSGSGWRQEEKGMTEDEIVGCHNWLDAHEFEQALGASDGQGSLECCSPWGHKESGVTERLNWSFLSGEEIVSLRKNINGKENVIALNIDCQKYC